MWHCMQGIGNAVSGLFGGVPGAGATMRTVVNVRAGGRTPISGAAHSVILLAVCLGLGRLAEAIPLACLAGILLKCGYDVIDVAYLQRLPQLPVSSVLVMVGCHALQGQSSRTAWRCA
jgi:sulfate permease, SulP family